MKNGKHWIGFALGLAVSIAAAAGQPIVIGEAFELSSKVMGEERTVLIGLPQGYEGSEDGGFPVLYLLDARTNFQATTGIVRQLTQSGQAPPMIVVGITNTERTRDLTPTHPTPAEGEDDAFSTSGGADRFLDFFQEELVPWVESNYRTRPFRVLVGHSFGGLFSVHALLTRTDLFDAYISLSPSLWWDDEGPLRGAEQVLDRTVDGRRFLYLTLGAEGGQMQDAFVGFQDWLRHRAPAWLEWKAEFSMDDDHGSIPLRGTVAGLQHVFSRWRLPAFLRQTTDLAQLDAHFASLSEMYGYEIATPERTVNNLGYRLLGAGNTEAAIQVLTENVSRFPGSANVHDSLGEALENAGRNEEARASFGRACERGKEISDPNTEVYCRNYERLGH